MKYKCLILDHDDTAVNSTKTIHYPAFKKFLSKYRPKINFTLEDFFSYSFDPGFHSMCYDILAFSNEEMNIQYDLWKRETTGVMPPFYDGFICFIQRFLEQDGILIISSHSISYEIKKHYNEFKIKPHAVYGWDTLPENRKPSPFAIVETIKRYVCR